MKTFTKSELAHFTEFYVQNGYAVFRGLVDPELVEIIRSRVMSEIEKGVANDADTDLHELSVTLMDRLEDQHDFRDITDSTDMIELVSRIVGLDVAIFNHDALWINAPKDDHPVLNKGLHTDAWTGTSVNTLFVKFFLTDCDEFNGLTVAPGSHLQGLIPVRNRSVDDKLGVKFDTMNLSMVKKGDVVIWHPLLLHATTGHSDENYRISITSRYTSTETEFSTQERALGYRTLRVSPSNQILRLIGSDSLLPFRTYGGFVGIDKRMRKLYGCSN